MRFGFSVRMKNDPRNKFLSVRKPGTTRGIRKVPAAAVLQDLLLPDPIVISHGPYVVPREVVRILGIFSESPRENPLLPLEKFSNLSLERNPPAPLSLEKFSTLSLEGNHLPPFLSSVDQALHFLSLEETTPPSPPFLSSIHSVDQALHFLSLEETTQPSPPFLSSIPSVDLALHFLSLEETTTPSPPFPSSTPSVDQVLHFLSLEETKPPSRFNRFVDC
ncbi:hypothetical protein AMTRI_Chr01g129390 [Amborella trichopoda]